MDMYLQYARLQMTSKISKKSFMYVIICIFIKNLLQVSVFQIGLE